MKAVVDRIVQFSNRYQLTNVETGEVLGTFDFDEVTGTVQQVGTEIDAELFDSIADDLAANAAAILAVDQKANEHIERTDNPHNVTKAQVGLENVANEQQYSESNPPPYPVVPNGSYSELGAGTHISTQIPNDADLNTYYGAEYWGKVFYAGGSHTILNCPVENGVVFCLSVYRASGYTMQCIIAANSTNETGAPTVYNRSITGSGVFGDWEESVTSKGSYPGLGAGYLARNAFLNRSGGVAVWEVGKVKFSDLSAYRITGAYSCIMLVNGAYQSQNTVNPNESGIIELDFENRQGVLTAGTATISILAGNLDTKNFLFIADNDGFTLYYISTDPYGTAQFTVISEVWSYIRVNCFSFTMTGYGDTAPEGAVYAVRRIEASHAEKADKLSNTSAIGSPTQPVYFSAKGVPVACDNKEISITVENLESSVTLTNDQYNKICSGIYDVLVYYGTEFVKFSNFIVTNGKAMSITLAKTYTDAFNFTYVSCYIDTDKSLKVSYLNGSPVPVPGIEDEGKSLAVKEGGKEYILLDVPANIKKTISAMASSVSMVPYGGQATTLSVLASGGVYNITANGFLRIAYRTTAADNFISMKQVSSSGADMWGFLANGQKSYGSGYPFIYMPVAKGDHIKVDFSSSVKIIQVQLIKVKTV